jgi:hypothetical protein
MDSLRRVHADQPDSLFLGVINYLNGIAVDDALHKNRC